MNPFKTAPGVFVTATPLYKRTIRAVLEGSDADGYSVDSIEDQFVSSSDGDSVKFCPNSHDEIVTLSEVDGIIEQPPKPVVDAPTLQSLEKYSYARMKIPLAMTDTRNPHSIDTLEITAGSSTSPELESTATPQASDLLLSQALPQSFQQQQQRQQPEQSNVVSQSLSPSLTMSSRSAESSIIEEPGDNMRKRVNIHMTRVSMVATQNPASISSSRETTPWSKKCVVPPTQPPAEENTTASLTPAKERILGLLSKTPEELAQKLHPVLSLRCNCIDIICLFSHTDRITPTMSENLVLAACYDISRYVQMSFFAEVMSSAFSHCSLPVKDKFVQCVSKTVHSIALKEDPKGIHFLESMIKLFQCNTHRAILLRSFILHGYMFWRRTVVADLLIQAADIYKNACVSRLCTFVAANCVPLCSNRVSMGIVLKLIEADPTYGGERISKAISDKLIEIIHEPLGPVFLRRAITAPKESSIVFINAIIPNLASHSDSLMFDRGGAEVLCDILAYGSRRVRVRLTKSLMDSPNFSRMMTDEVAMNVATDLWRHGSSRDQYTIYQHFVSHPELRSHSVASKLISMVWADTDHLENLTALLAPWN